MAGPKNLVLVAMALMLTAGLLSTIIHLCVRFLSPRYPAIEIVFLRTFITMLLTLPLVLRPGQRAWRTNAPGLQFLRGVVGAVSMAAWYYALGAMPLGDAGALSMTTAIFVTIGAAIWLREDVDAARWSAVAIGLLGAVIILKPTPENWSLAAFAALFASALWAVSLLMAKHLARHDQSLTITFYQVLTIAPLAGLATIGRWTTPTLDDWLVFGGMSVVAGVANYSTVHALRLANASILMPADYAKIVWMMVWGYLIFSEIPGLSTWIGAALIVASTAYITWREKSRANSDKKGTASS